MQGDSLKVPPIRYDVDDWRAPKPMYNYTHRRARAKRIDASIRKSLGEYQEDVEPAKKEEKAFKHIS